MCSCIVFLGLRLDLFIVLSNIFSTRLTEASIGLHLTWPNHFRQDLVIFYSIGATHTFF